MIDTIKKYTKGDDDGKSLALRLLIHFMGDIHQPLHCSDRYTAEHPKGDKGGNDFELNNHYSAPELHAVWDNVIYQYHASVKRPFTEDSFAEQEEIAVELRNSFKFSKTKVNMLDYDKMADESYEIAVGVYDGLTAGKD